MSFLLRNWHLKLSAVLLATVLYTGLVFSGSFSEATLSVPVEAVNQPDSSQLLSGEVSTVAVTYRAANDLAGTLLAQAFVARVDLADYDMERAPEPQVLDIEVVPLTEGIEILSTEPDEVRVAIDRIETRSVPVDVDAGTIPDGLEIDDPVVSPEEVEVRGASSVVRLVDRALARVRIDESGIDFNQPVDLVAVDVAGQEVGAGLVEPEPGTVSVQIDVRETETTQTLPIRPDISGTPAPGFALTSLSIEPSLVTLRGAPDALSDVSEVLTEPISIAAASSSEEVETELVLPPDTSLAEGEAAGVVVNVEIAPSVSSRTFVVGVVCSGAGENACLPSVDQVSLTLSGPSDALSGLAAADVTPTLDAAGLGPGTYDLAPSIGGLPDGVELLGIVPGAVTVTIQAPSTPAPSPTPTPAP